MPIVITLYNAIFYLWCLSELLILILTRTRAATGEVRDLGSLRLLWITICCSITLGSLTSSIERTAAFGRTGIVLPICLGFLLAGLAIRWSAIYTLGRSFSANVAIHATQTITKTGLFRWMRHPSYTGLELIFLAIGLATRNWIGLFLCVVPPTIALLYRIRVEEVALTSAFGGQYLIYSTETKRLIPGIY